MKHKKQVAKAPPADMKKTAKMPPFMLAKMKMAKPEKDMPKKDMPKKDMPKKDMPKKKGK